MNKYRRLNVLLLVLLPGWLAFSCSREFDEHYNTSSRLEKNIVEVLEEDGRFSSFVEIVDHLNLRSTLGEAAIYTCLAPRNEHVEAWLQANGYASFEQASEAELLSYVNYHFINGMYYVYDLEKRYREATTSINKSRAVFYTTRTSARTPGKSIRLFTAPFFELQQDDYQGLYGREGEGFMVESARISPVDRDIDANNGVIHVLEDPLVLAPRADLALAADPETSIFTRWLEKHVQWTLGAKDEFGWVDTTLYKGFTFGRNLADEGLRSTLLVPTNQAIMEYFEPWLETDLYNTIDSVPERVMHSLIRSAVVENAWFESDLKRNEPVWQALYGHPHAILDVPSAITGAVPSSNANIYKLDKIIESPLMHSVAGGVYLKFRRYRQWYWMFMNTRLEEGLIDPLYYQHSPKTVLLQSDENWGFPLAQDMTPEAREQRYEECRTGIFNMDVRTEGGFRKRFYPTEFGYILYDEGRFYDYTGHSVALVSATPAWERTNGAIFEIDGFLTPLDRLDPTRSVYALMQQDPELSMFAQICTKAGVATELNLGGFFTYTVLAPSNTALTEAGVDPAALSEEEALRLVNSYIIPNRSVFTDGVFTGQIPDRNGEMVTVSGAWESFTITRPDANVPSFGDANLQATNGVLHKLNGVF